VLFSFLCVVNLRGGVMSTSLCNLFGLNGLCYKVLFGTWVLVEV